MKWFKKSLCTFVLLISSTCISKMNYFELQWSVGGHSGTIYKWQEHAESCATALQKNPFYLRAIIVDLRKRYPNFFAGYSDEDVINDVRFFFNPKITCKSLKTKERNKILRENPNATFVDDIPESQELLDAALMYAVWTNHLDLVNKVLKIGANANSERKPLLAAAQDVYVDIAKTLIEQGANVNVQNDIGWTPLHFAINTYLHSLGPKRVLSMAKLLLKKKADMNIKNYKGVSAYDMAIKAGGAMAELFINHKP